MVGTNDLRSGGQRYKVKKLIQHEKYNRPPFAYDIGLIRVDGRIEFNEKVQPIKYSNKFVEGGTHLQTTGWGRVSAGGPIPQMLQVLKVDAVTNEECYDYHGSTVHDSHLCTLTEEGEGVCSVSANFMAIGNGVNAEPMLIILLNLNKVISIYYFLRG